MSDRMPVGPALEQLRESISILRELGNAGSRDNSFKQWRQVTLTLLQRIWAGDQARAVRFRRIPFSAPSARADAKATREWYVRGVNEAIAYLESLELELEPGSGGSGRNLVRPPEAVAAPREDASGNEAPPMGAGAPPATSVGPAAPPEPAVREKAAPAKPESGRTAARSRPRLKDMLGFSDEGTGTCGSAAPSEPVSPPARRAPAPAAPLRPAVAPAAPDAEHDSGEAALDLGFELAIEAEMDADLPPATLREMLDRGPTPRAGVPTGAAGEVLSMAAMVEQLGVPPQRRAIVRAALMDLGHQMAAPPVHWVPIRQALAFMMDYPQIARRVIPMLLPYLDEAA